MQVFFVSKARLTECSSNQYAKFKPSVRSSFLFVNFMLIITTLYQLKPASRSLFIAAFGADQLPYIWIGSALSMALVVACYQRLVLTCNRIYIVLGTCLTFTAILIGFRMLLNSGGAAVAAGFYIFVDILGVVLVEQFWSLTNSIFSTTEGKRWYGIVGTGGLVGGIIGGGVAAFLIKATPLQTPDLLVTAAATIMIIFGLTYILGRMGAYCEVDASAVSRTQEGDLSWRSLVRNRYFLIIAGMLLLAQLASPLIEFQFLKSVETAYPEREARTAFLSLFFSVLGIVSVGVNLGLTPLVHRRLGALAGLMVQPLLMSLCSWGYLMFPSLAFGAATKISDRGLSYSINRASRELLYVPVDPVLIYQAKAWIDMFGYRMFKIFGSVLILAFTQWLPVTIAVKHLSWLTLIICGIWIGLVRWLRPHYQNILQD